MTEHALRARAPDMPVERGGSYLRRPSAREQETIFIRVRGGTSSRICLGVVSFRELFIASREQARLGDVDGDRPAVTVGREGTRQDRAIVHWGKRDGCGYPRGRPSRVASRGNRHQSTNRRVVQEEATGTLRKRKFGGTGRLDEPYCRSRSRA